TNACLDFLESRKERRSGDNVTSAEAALGPQPHVPWLQPFPDRLLEPDARLVSREALELGYLVALQCLPPKQRAALICCDVLEWSAKEAAELLSLSVASVNSALQRARETLQNEQQTGVRVRHEATPEQEQLLLRAYVKATEDVDVPALTALLREDVRCTMPPVDLRFTARDEAVAGWVEGGFGSEEYRDFRCIVTRTNGLPAVACYRRAPGAAAYTPLALDVLKLHGEQVVEITTFELAPFVRDLDLPATL
ncbi:MAG TPA: RNA polymerase subunit sigma-70, partial [Polyangiaceae bacterium]|nr:RNA polymerase subunit sigma-70 [Polyangiaceae bacterium]